MNMSAAPSVPGPTAEQWQTEADQYDAWAGEHTSTDTAAPSDAGPSPRP